MKKPLFPRRPNEPTPGGLFIAQMLWLLAGVLFLGFGGFLVHEHTQQSTMGFAVIALIILFAAAGLACCVLGYRLFTGDRAARTQLSWVGLITALPLLLRFGRYSILAAIIMFSVVLMWMPASNKYFKIVDPKPAKPRR
ncbi:MULTISPECIES: hypothetical protein [Glutamicibacter]|uniref:Uncharacterized protein n=2 Tax=Glutamicibacter arilaitensis TaxID=256701 RepID=A0A2N7S2D1_9MICC|nr:hypothetical protein [Glutamicibacter arilaitensis]PMQ20290.1 hypothetical protein CIK84_01310 [Glutamicibacter arilaitensis]CBT76619.1 hypothetical membrane protein [Glutamicibacter arilaitensis Re117]